MRTTARIWAVGRPAPLERDTAGKRETARAHGAGGSHGYRWLAVALAVGILFMVIHWR